MRQSRRSIAAVAFAALALPPFLSAPWLYATVWAGESAGQFLGPHMPYDAFARLPTQGLEAVGTTFEIGFAPDELGVHRSVVIAWITESARAIFTYFGRFPVKSVRILVVPVSGNGIHGTSWGYRGAAIRIPLGRGVTDDELLGSWVMVHEMVHLALPSLPDQQNWLDEGLATYVEPIARAQAGQLSAEQVWRGFVKGMPQGRPSTGDQGLDHTPTWGRTYWGGAIFCLLTDTEIRRRTNNARGLRDALRAITAQGGNKENVWSLDRVIEVGDKATGVPVLKETYERMKAAPADVDLPALWAELGILLQGNTVAFDDSAPLAAIRKAITAP